MPSYFPAIGLCKFSRHHALLLLNQLLTTGVPSFPLHLSSLPKVPFFSYNRPLTKLFSRNVHLLDVERTARMYSRVERMRSSVHGGHDDPAREGSDEWEVRPGGMLVQTRVGSETEYHNQAQVSNIRVKVKHGAACHEVLISPQASFGELKKKLADPTGLHHEDQKLIYKKRERGSKQYLDVAGVRDGSKIVLVEDVLSRERRCLEMLKTAKIEKASKTLEGISSELDKMSDKVLALQKVASQGGKVESMDVEKLTDALMKLYIKLDSLVVQGDLNLQKRLQVKKLQEHIEMLDALKLKSPLGQSLKRTSTKQAKKKQVRFEGLNLGTHQTPRDSDPVVVTTKWETFE